MVLFVSSSSFSSNSEGDNFISTSIPFHKETSIYPFPGQPQHLIYYAKVHRNRNRGNDETPERKTNCFSKAFAWYTKERHPQFMNDPSPNKEAPPDNVAGFASWLDNKYAEYLRENGIESDNNGQAIHLNECCKPKRSNRSKSPRQKEQRIKEKSSEAGDSVRESFEFILEPRGLDLPMKESPCCHKSNPTFQSVDTASNRTSKTQSAWSVCCPNNNESLKRIIILEKSTVHEECECDFMPRKTVAKKPTSVKETIKKPSTATVTCSADLTPIRPTADANTTPKTSVKNSACDCTKAPITADAQCQTENEEVAGVKHFVSFNNDSKVIQKVIGCQCTKDEKPSVMDKCQCTKDEKPSAMDKSCQTEDGVCPLGPLCCPCDKAVQCQDTRLVVIHEPQLILATTRSEKVLIPNACQTEDFAVTEDVMVLNAREYPLFMKIICVSKFSHARVD